MAGIREQKKQETRQAICAAAMKLFTEKSYEATSIEDIALDAGIGKTTIYGCFSNKEEIFVTYCDAELERAFSQFRSDCKEERPLLDKLVRFFLSKFAFVTENREFGRQMMREMLFPRMINEQAELHDRRYLDHLQAIFIDAEQQGDIAPGQDSFMLAVHAFSVYLGVLTGWFKGHVSELEQAENALRQLFSQLLEGVQS